MSRTEEQRATEISNNRNTNSISKKTWEAPTIVELEVENTNSGRVRFIIESGLYYVS